MKLEFQGNQAFLTKLKNLPQEMQDLVEEEIAIAMDFTYNNAQLAAPTDMAGGFGIRGTAYKDVRGLEGEVGYRSRYAAYVEFGTGAKVRIPQGLEEYAMTFFVNGKGRLPANPFLFPAFFRATKEFEENLRTAIQDSWEK